MTMTAHPSDHDKHAGSARAQRLAGRQAEPTAIRPAGAKAVRAPSVPRAPPLPRKERRPTVEVARDPAGGEAVSTVPPVPPGFREVELTPMVPQRAWVRMLYDEADHTYLYEVVEPELSPDEATIQGFLRDTLVRTLDGRSATKEVDWAKTLIDAIRQAVVDHSIRISEAGARRIEYHLVRDFLGYGPIDVLMRDPMIEDISCDGPGIPIYLFHRKYESIKTTVRFKDEDELDSFVIRLAQRSRKHISVADPLLDATLPDGSRLQATLSREVTTRGSSFTVRKFRADPLTPPDLIRLGTLSAEMSAWFWFAMELGHSFILAGGTASGKTTSLNAISQFIPPEKKIVSIEDTREINLSHENWIAGVTRTGFGGEMRSGKQAGSIDMYKLLEAALRQRPEYLLVGEVRGSEALTLFQAMATGHAVYSTMHADSVPSAVYRLENPPINVPRMMLQTLDIVAIQAQVRIGERMGRRIREVTEVVGFDPETRELLTNTVFEWDSAADVHRYLGKSYVLEQVMESRHMSEEDVESEWRNRVEVLQWMMDSNVRHVTDVARVFSRYYRDPKGLLAGVRAAEPPEKITAGEKVASPPRPLEAAPGPPTIALAPADGEAMMGTLDQAADQAIDGAEGPLQAPKRRKAGAPPDADEGGQAVSAGKHTADVPRKQKGG
ncbi:MAG: type II/IV secretion system ATPase subunit [Thermoplasmatota archaeon]